MSFVRSESTGTGLKPHHHRVPSGIRGRPTSAQSAKSTTSAKSTISNKTSAKKQSKNAAQRPRSRARSSSRASEPSRSLGTSRPPSVSSENRRPSWNDTWNTDFDEFKLSPRELQQRKESFKSKHLEAARLDEEEKAIARAARTLRETPKNTGRPSKSGILQEVLCNENEFRQFLGGLGGGGGDHVVRDLFGSPVVGALLTHATLNQPRIFCSVPTFTQAPSFIEDGATNSLNGDTIKFLNGGATNSIDLNTQRNGDFSSIKHVVGEGVRPNSANGKENRDGRESPSCLNRTDLTEDAAPDVAKRPLSAEEKKPEGSSISQRVSTVLEGSAFQGGLNIDRFQKVIENVEHGESKERERKKRELLKEKEALAAQLKNCVEPKPDSCSERCEAKFARLEKKITNLEGVVEQKSKQIVDLKSLLDLLTNDVLSWRQEQKEETEKYETRSKEQDAVVKELQEKLGKFGQILELSMRNSNLETSLLPSLLNASQVRFLLVINCQWDIINSVIQSYACYCTIF